MNIKDKTKRGVPKRCKMCSFPVQMVLVAEKRANSKHLKESSCPGRCFHVDQDPLESQELTCLPQAISLEQEIALAWISMWRTLCLFLISLETKSKRRSRQNLPNVVPGNFVIYVCTYTKICR